MQLRIKFLLFICLMLVCQIAVTTDSFAKEHVYKNRRYNFAIKLPDSDWHGRESDNGDGATFQSNLLYSSVTAYGTRGYEFRHKGAVEAYREMQRNFGQIERESVNAKNGSFEIVGLSRSKKRYQGIRGYTKHGATIIIIVKTERSQSRFMFDTLFNAVKKSIKIH